MHTWELIYRLHHTYKVNEELYLLRKLPLIGKKLPYTLHGNQVLKFVVALLAVGSGLAKAAFLKLLYFLVMAALPVFVLYGGFGTGWTERILSGRGFALSPDGAGGYVHVLFFLCLAGAWVHQKFLTDTKEMYYAVILMRMDGRRYELVEYVTFLVSTAAGYLTAGILFGLVFGMKIRMGLLLTASVIGVKLAVSALRLYRYQNTKDYAHLFPKNSVGLLVTGLVAAAYLPVLFHHPLPLNILVIGMLAGAVAGICCIPYIRTFPYYREICQQLSWKVLHPDTDEVQLETLNSRNLISDNTTVSSNRHGFEYLHELFVKRHKKLLWRRSVITSVICGLLFVALVAWLYVQPEFRPDFKELFQNHFAKLLFFMYALNTGTGYTQALFVNCDHSLLTYSFYKQPKAILELYWIRLREIIKVNLLPAVVIGAGMVMGLLVSGGADTPLYYVVLFVGTVAMSLLFSVHYLTWYYLLQPYTAGTEVKSIPYRLLMGVTYVVCYTMINLHVDTLLFGGLMILLCVVYGLISCVAVYCIAPKTFRIRS